MRKLTVYPVKTVEPHICASCAYHRWSHNGYWYCVRNRLVGGDTGDRGDITTTCAGWRSVWKHGALPGHDDGITEQP